MTKAKPSQHSNLTSADAAFLKGFALAAKRLKHAPEGFAAFHLSTLRVVKQGEVLEGTAAGLEAGLLAALGAL